VGLGVQARSSRRWSGERTAETRWFLAGDPPSPWVRWFDTMPATDPQDRTDLYLPLDTGVLGVKLRASGDRLEFKLREHDHGRRPFPGGAHGAVEGWQKWSLPQRRWGTPRRRLPWVTVRKVRRMVTYELSPAGGVSLTDGTVEAGCRVELSRLEAAGQEWSTVGFEAFGPDERRLDALVAAANAVLAQLTEGDQGHGLAGAVSCAYPEWLRMLP
jgi:hypothetical protein